MQIKDNNKIPANTFYGVNQNGVFEFVAKEISCLPTLTASLGLKIWYFTTEGFLQDHL